MEVPPAAILAWLGPAIGPAVYEVGDEVRAAFLAVDRAAGAAFARSARGRWLADLYTLARQRLRGAGVRAIFGGGYCTYADRLRFYSYRRDGATGRMASGIWIKPRS
jgi:copper oxidase (laccase) domain-containing protein